MESYNIVFRKYKNEITAIFLDDKFNDSYKLTCYSHIGQHSGCCISWLYNDTKPALKNEYVSLLSELQKIYFDCTLTVKNRLPAYEKICKLFR